MTSVADSFLAAARLTAMRNSPPPYEPGAAGLSYYPAVASSSQGNAEGLITPPPLPSAAPVGFGNAGRDESSSTRVSFDDDEDVPPAAAGMDWSPAKKTAGAVSASASDHPSSRNDVDEDEDGRGHHGLVPVLGGGGYGYPPYLAHFEA